MDNTQKEIEKIMVESLFTKGGTISEAEAREIVNNKKQLQKVTVRNSTGHIITGYGVIIGETKTMIKVRLTEVKDYWNKLSINDIIGFSKLDGVSKDTRHKRQYKLDFCIEY
jgi:hypothetical protein